MDQDRTELLKDLAFFRQRGYDINTGEDFINMVLKHPITLDVSKVILRIKLEFNIKFPYKDEKKNIMMESPDQTYILRNWTSDNQPSDDHRLDDQPMVGIYLQDIILLVNHLRKFASKLYNEHWYIDIIDVGSVQYIIDSILGPIITIDMTFFMNF